LVGKTERFRSDLPQHSEIALSDLALAGDNGRAAVLVQPHNRRRAVPVAEAAAPVHVNAAAYAQAGIRPLRLVLRTPPDHGRGSKLGILWLWGERPPGSMAFMRRRSRMSMPSFSAARSQACSTAQSAEGLPKPRKAPVGTRFV